MSQENSIKERERQYQNLVSNIPGVVYRCANDSEYTMEFISNEIETLTGYSPNDFINNKIRTFTSIIHPDDKDLVSSTISKNITENDPYSIEYRLIARNNIIKWVHEKGRAILDDNGAVKHLDGVIIDITERIEAFEKLNVFYQFAKHSSQGFFITSLDFETTYINRILLNIINEKEPSNVIGKRIDEYFTAKDQTIFKETIIPSILKDEKWTGDLKFMSTDKISTPVITNMILIKDNKGKPLHICAIITNLKKHIEEEKHLNKKIKDLELFYKISIERELKMIKLKKQIKELEERLNFFEKNK